jgi:3-hydroxyisobutyrate dehydrogenase
MFIMVVYPDQLQQIVLSPQGGLLSSLSPGTILIDCSTSSPDLEVKIAAEATQKGIQYLDAPVSGGPSGAEEGSLAFMVGGERNTFERALPLFQLMGKKVVLQGEIGKGQYTKIVNQILIASNIMGVCEAYTFASKAALSLKDVFESVQNGAAGSFILDFAWPRIQTGDLKPGFYVEHFIKDLKIAIEEAGRLDLCLPALNLAKQLYHAVRNIAGQGIGTQGLISVFEALNGYEASTQSRHMR